MVSTWMRSGHKLVADSVDICDSRIIGKEDTSMSAYTNGLAFWKHFEEKQGAIFNCLKAEQYEELNEIDPRIG